MADAVALPTHSPQWEVVADTIAGGGGDTGDYYDNGNVTRTTLMIECTVGTVQLQVRDSNDQNWGPKITETWGVGNFVYNVVGSMQWRLVTSANAKVWARYERHK